MRRLVSLLASTVLALAGTVVLVSTASATPPNIPSEATARSELATLRVAADGSSSGYSRDKFPHWNTVSGACNTRETVLKRDGTNVVTDSSCAAVSGSWYSPYDGATWSAASDVDIDHMIPLANAWRTGASSWTQTRRTEFANDLSYPQLIAVTDNVNQSKGDQSPATWKPPRTAYWCTYAKMWVHVKYRYFLTINSAEKSALTTMLDSC
ncbi:MAG TPA: HNH endonuclease family protein [Actinophytocola sp.]|nr:HNH endonuclease family protein [Actinophytocola sp.]